MPDQRPTKATSIVLPAEFIDRAEALADRIEIPAELQAGGVRANRSVVLRMAIAEGLGATPREGRRRGGGTLNKPRSASRAQSLSGVDSA